MFDKPATPADRGWLGRYRGRRFAVLLVILLLLLAGPPILLGTGMSRGWFD